MYTHVGDYGTFYRQGNICTYVVTKQHIDASLQPYSYIVLDTIPEGYTPLHVVQVKQVSTDIPYGVLEINLERKQVLMLNDSGSSRTVRMTYGNTATYFTSDDYPNKWSFICWALCILLLQIFFLLYTH